MANKWIHFLAPLFANYLTMENILKCINLLLQLLNKNNYMNFKICQEAYRKDIGNTKGVAQILINSEDTAFYLFFPFLISKHKHSKINSYLNIYIYLY